jgi:hypothetical protein
MDLNLHRILWIDGLGGLLLCADFPLTIGSASIRPLPEIPIQADIGRRHALLHRDREGFAIERGDGMVEIHGGSVRRMFLEDRMRIQFAGRCELEFHQAIAGSDTAQLEIARGGRLPFPVRAVLLMGKAVTIAGDGRRSDIHVTGLQAAAAFVRTKEGFELRTTGQGGSGSVQERVEVSPGRPSFLRDLCLTLEEVSG